jgi:hypothetical protein
MTVEIVSASGIDVRAAVQSSVHAQFPQAAEIVDERLRASLVAHAGLIDGKVACVWGLEPLSILSGSAYMWLWTTFHAEGHKFIFVRHSQIELKRLMAEFHVICGHVLSDSEQSKRWLKWLGAEFGEPDIQGGKVFIPFKFERAA